MRLKSLPKALLSLSITNFVHHSLLSRGLTQAYSVTHQRRGATPDQSPPSIVRRQTENPARHNDDDDVLHCIMTLNFYTEIEDATDVYDDFYACQPIDSDGYREGMYRLDNLPEWVDRDYRQPLLDGQLVYMTIPHARLTLDSVSIPDMDAITVGDPPPVLQRHRSLRKPASIGKLKVVMLRISANDAAPDFSADELYDLLFTADPSMKIQYERCSFGQLFMEPTDYGIMDIKVDMDAQGNTNAALMNAGETIANSMLNEADGKSIRSYADILMFTIPPGTGGWAAFATVNGKQSVYNNKWAAYLGGQMHEVGHNLGLRHAFENGIEYHGRTGYMGSAPQQTKYPEQCFNAQNHYALGWYGDRTFEAEAENPVLIKMIAFVDFLYAADNEYAIVKVGDLYMQFNRAKAFNKDTLEQPDKLVVVRGEPDHTDLLVGLDVGEQYATLLQGEEEITIEVCEKNIDPYNPSVETLLVSVGYGDSLCGVGMPRTPRPVTAAQVPPTPKPVATTAPTLRPIPTMNPTHGPTKVPTPWPTFPPSPKPTDTPTPEPTPLPTPKPVPSTPVYTITEPQPTTRAPSQAPLPAPIPLTKQPVALPRTPSPVVLPRTPSPFAVMPAEPRTESPTASPTQVYIDTGLGASAASQAMTDSGSTPTTGLIIGTSLSAAIAVSTIIAMVCMWRRCFRHAPYKYYKDDDDLADIDDKDVDKNDKAKPLKHSGSISSSRETEQDPWTDLESTTDSSSSEEFVDENGSVAGKQRRRLPSSLGRQGQNQNAISMAMLEQLRSRLAPGRAQGMSSIARQSLQPSEKVKILGIAPPCRPEALESAISNACWAPHDDNNDTAPDADEKNFLSWFYVDTPCYHPSDTQILESTSKRSSIASSPERQRTNAPSENVIAKPAVRVPEHFLEAVQHPKEQTSHRQMKRSGSSADQYRRVPQLEKQSVADSQRRVQAPKRLAHRDSHTGQAQYKPVMKNPVQSGQRQLSSPQRPTQTPKQPAPTAQQTIRASQRPVQTTQRHIQPAEHYRRVPQRSEPVQELPVRAQRRPMELPYQPVSIAQQPGRVPQRTAEATNHALIVDQQSSRRVQQSLAKQPAPPTQRPVRVTKRPLQADPQPLHSPQQYARIPQRLPAPSSLQSTRIPQRLPAPASQRPVRATQRPVHTETRSLEVAQPSMRVPQRTTTVAQPSVRVPQRTASVAQQSVRVPQRTASVAQQAVRIPARVSQNVSTQSSVAQTSSTLSNRPMHRNRSPSRQPQRQAQLLDHHPGRDVYGYPDVQE